MKKIIFLVIVACFFSFFSLAAHARDVRLGQNIVSKEVTGLWRSLYFVATQKGAAIILYRPAGATIIVKKGQQVELAVGIGLIYKTKCITVTYDGENLKTEGVYRCK